jgi:hypothetical protein
MEFHMESNHAPDTEAVYYQVVFSHASFASYSDIVPFLTTICGVMLVTHSPVEVDYVHIEAISSEEKSWKLLSCK